MILRLYPKIESSCFSHLLDAIDKIKTLLMLSCPIHVHFKVTILEFSSQRNLSLLLYLPHLFLHTHSLSLSTF